jgi:hypothetical protein
VLPSPAAINRPIFYASGTSFWSYCSSAFWLRVELRADARVSEKHTVSLFRADGDKMSIQNSGIYLWFYTAPKPRRTTLFSPPWKPQISHRFDHFEIVYQMVLICRYLYSVLMASPLSSTQNMPERSKLIINMAGTYLANSCLSDCDDWYCLRFAPGCWCKWGGCNKTDQNCEWVEKPFTSGLLHIANYSKCCPTINRNTIKLLRNLLYCPSLYRHAIRRIG